MEIKMTTGRLEAFSDGVIAIIITITVLLIDLPSRDDWHGLAEIIPLAIVYLVSFIMIGMHWANHHHLMQVTKHVNGKILWANLYYLFALSFFPVATGWVGRSKFAAVPTSVYVIINLAEALGYIMLQQTIVHSHDCVILKQVVNESKKEGVTIVILLAALITSFIEPIHLVAYIFLIAMALIWIVPDIRMSKIFEEYKNFEE